MPVPTLRDPVASAAHRAALADVVPLDGWPAAIRQGREDRGENQSEFARRTGLAQSHASAIEAGRVTYVPGGVLTSARALGFEPVLVRSWAVPQPCIPAGSGASADGGHMADQDRLTLLTGYDPSRISHLAVDDALDLACEHPAVLLDLGAERYDEAAIRLDEIAATAARAARRCRLAAAEVGR